MSSIDDGPSSDHAAEATEAFERFDNLEADLRRLGADWEADREVPAAGDDRDRGWVVVAVDRLLNGRPAARGAYGPFTAIDDARRYADQIEENGTRIFVVGISDPIGSAHLPPNA